MVLGVALSGSGEDTLRLAGTGETLDLTAISDLFIQDIETIDLSGDLAGGSNTLILDNLEILNIDADSNTLIVTGDVGDAVAGDLTGAIVDEDLNAGFVTFTLDNAVLLIEDGIDTSGLLVKGSGPGPPASAAPGAHGYGAVECALRRPLSVRLIRQIGNVACLAVRVRAEFLLPEFGTKDLLRD
jgi:hypothetical protein